MKITKGNIKREIAEGKLCLKADEILRCRFQFFIDDISIGCYALRSTAPFEVRAERAWNVGGLLWDPSRQLYVPQLAAPQFPRIKPASRIVIRELEYMKDGTVDEVSFTFAAFGLSGCDRKGESGRVLNFEILDLQGVKLDG